MAKAVDSDITPIGKDSKIDGINDEISSLKEEIQEISSKIDDINERTKITFDMVDTICKLLRQGY